MFLFLNILINLYLKSTKPYNYDEGEIQDHWDGQCILLEISKIINVGSDIDRVEILVTNFPINLMCMCRKQLKVGHQKSVFHR